MYIGHPWLQLVRTFVKMETQSKKCVVNQPFTCYHRAQEVEYYDRVN